MSQNSKSIVLAMSIFGGILLLLFSPMAIKAYRDNRVSCVSETVSYSARTVDSPNYYNDYNQITQKGVNGERRICTKGDGTQLSNTVILEPTDEIRTRGTMQYAPVTAPPSTAYEAPSQSVRVGAICRDGWRSSATGRGACSWHGGVSEWIYN